MSVITEYVIQRMSVITEYVIQRMSVITEYVIQRMGMTEYVPSCDYMITHNGVELIDEGLYFLM